ncbi:MULTISPECIES: hypothetical protein [unclassified Pseudomonas]|uniref:hypothetical protein n=1 Tax=unclassified Pseudomonas TaxID=196821 RepID=UPI002E8184BB|nr:hypothetical protein [Pseudomonas sp. AM14(2022)]
MNFALTTLASAGVTTALLAALGWLLRTWIGERFKASVKHEYDDRLERLKSELRAQSDLDLAALKSEVDRQAEKLKIAALSFSDVQKATIPRKIDAVDNLWEAVRQARNYIPGELYVCDVLTDDELTDMRKTVPLNDLRLRLLDIDAVELSTRLFGDAEKIRPHVGEYIWALFATYHGLLSRILFLISGKNEDRRWYRDENVLRLIASAFGQNRVDVFRCLQSNRYDWLRREFEGLLFVAFEHLLNGKAFSEAALRQAQDMESQLVRAKQDQG